MREDGRKKSSGSSADVPSVSECVEAVFGCKWSLRILELIRSGIHRPGEIERLRERYNELDDMLSTLPPRWHNERDNFQLLAQQIVSIAAGGNDELLDHRI